MEVREMEVRRNNFLSHSGESGIISSGPHLSWPASLWPASLWPASLLYSLPLRRPNNWPGGKTPAGKCRGPAY
jgi:hypothetical protein